MGPDKLVWVHFDYEDVQQVCNRLSLQAAAGLARIPMICLKKGGITLFKILAKLYNLSVTTGVVPHQWKEAYITPIWRGKGSPKDQPKSYWPISLTSHLAKVFE